jgi:hypothetical protein
MGYKDNSGVLVNRKNGLRYISADHIVTGLEYRPGENSLITLEGFFKHYLHYPFSLTDSIPLASKGADFGTIGDEPLVPVSSGKAYGFEIYGRATDLLGFNTLFSYTFVHSKFRDERPGSDEKYIPTSWDNRHILNITANRSFKHNWDIGFKWRFVGGAPYSPYNYEESRIKEAWDAKGAPYLDYTKYNSLRSKPFHQLDIRIDKQYFFNKWSLMLYVDVQNVYNFKAAEPDLLVRKSFVDPGYDDIIDGKYYDLEYLKQDGAGTILPTIGIIVEF